jgi:hypothetical protein
MPNWCFQNLTVYGKSEEDVKPFLDAIKDKENEGKVSLNQLHPMPKCLEGSTSGFFTDEEKRKEHEEQAKRNIEECGYADWYEWNNANWGTKWGACDVELNDDLPVKDGYIASLKFESAWSPAVDLIRNISSKFPRLMFSLSYTEESDAFAGVEVFVQGFSEGEFTIEPDTEELPDMDEVGEDAYYDAYDKQREKILTMLDDMEDELTESAKEAIPT